MNHKVFPRCWPEEEVEVPSCQPQRLVDVFRYEDVAVGRDRTLDVEDWAFQCLVLEEEKWNWINR